MQSLGDDNCTAQFVCPVPSAMGLAAAAGLLDSASASTNFGEVRLTLLRVWLTQCFLLSAGRAA